MWWEFIWHKWINIWWNAIISQQTICRRIPEVGPKIWKCCDGGMSSLQWLHNEHDGLSNHRRVNCLLNRLFRHRSKYQKSAPLAFVRGIHRLPGDSPHKRPVTLKIFPFDDVIMMHNTLAYTCIKYILELGQCISEHECFTVQKQWQNIGMVWSYIAYHCSTSMHLAFMHRYLDAVIDESILIIRPLDSALHTRQRVKIDHLFYLLIAGVCSARHDRASANSSLTWSALNLLVERRTAWGLYCYICATS